MPVLFLVRHGQASFGSSNYDELSALGRRQVARLFSHLGSIGVDAPEVVAGTLARQQQSAAPWVDRGSSLVIDPGFDEFRADEVVGRYGDVRVRLDDAASRPGMTTGEYQRVLDKALAGWVASAGEDGGEESWRVFRGRTYGALQAAAGALGPGQAGVVFTSAGAIASCVVQLLDAPDALFLGFNRVCVNGAYTKIAVGASGLSLLSFNEHGHLPAGEVTYR